MTPEDFPLDRTKRLLDRIHGELESGPGFAMLSGKQIHGWPSGTAVDSEDTMSFSALADVRPRVETFPLAEANAGYAKMMENQVRFRAVLTMG